MDQEAHHLLVNNGIDLAADAALFSFSDHGDFLFRLCPEKASCHQGADNKALHPLQRSSPGKIVEELYHIFPDFRMAGKEAQVFIYLGCFLVIVPSAEVAVFPIASGCILLFTDDEEEFGMGLDFCFCLGVACGMRLALGPLALALWPALAQ